MRGQGRARRIHFRGKIERASFSLYAPAPFLLDPESFPTLTCGAAQTLAWEDEKLAAARERRAAAAATRRGRSARRKEAAAPAGKTGGGAAVPEQWGLRGGRAHEGADTTTHSALLCTSSRTSIHPRGTRCEHDRVQVSQIA